MHSRNHVPEDEVLSEGLQLLWETHQSALSALRNASNECNKTASRYSHMVEDLDTLSVDLEAIQADYAVASEPVATARIAYFNARRTWLIAREGNA